MAAKSAPKSFTFDGPAKRPSVAIFNWIGDAARHVGWKPELSTERILDAARRHTGLEDWGDEYFLEPLDRLVDAFKREAELSPFGHLIIYGLLLMGVQNRLFVREYLRAHPQALEAELGSALIVVGMPRTGTTLLYNLFAQDPGARPLLGWESLMPAPRAENAERADSRQRFGKWIERGINWFAQALRDIHPFRSDGPEECTWLMANSFMSLIFAMFGRVPSYMEWLWRLDETQWEPAYRDYRDQLLAIQHQRGSGQWVLKSPVHIMSAAPLLKTLPSARVLFTDRHPREVVPSTCSLFAVMRALSARRVESGGLGTEVCTDLARGLNRMEAALSHYPERVMRVGFRELVSDKIGTVRAAYSQFGLDFSDDFDFSMRRWIENDPHRASHRYALEQFGLSENTLCDCFAAAAK